MTKIPNANFLKIRKLILATFYLNGEASRGAVTEQAEFANLIPKKIPRDNDRGPNSEDPLFLTIPQAAALEGYCPETIRHAGRRNEIKMCGLRSCYRVRRTDSTASKALPASASLNRP